MSCRTGCHQT